MNIGVICPSEIAIRRFMPALQQIPELKFVGIGVCTKAERFMDRTVKDEVAKTILDVEHEKAEAFIQQYGGKIFEGYETIATSKEIDALYIPLPPALHYKWAKVALEHGKHVLVEKPSTINSQDTKELVQIANDRRLALHENYMFAFHEQLDKIDDLINSGEIGDVRLYRISFGFPRRSQDDFRYNKMLGGGALIDAGGYTIKYAERLLGETAELKYAQLNYIDGMDVDIYGSAALVNKYGVTAQIAFGMDNNYKCELEVWGSKGSITTGRVLTAPTGFVPQVKICHGNDVCVKDLPSDDAFQKSIRYFLSCIENDEIRRENYQVLIRQAERIDEFRKLAGEK